jgi:hypothetical protein
MLRLKLWSISIEFDTTISAIPQGLFSSNLENKKSCKLPFLPRAKNLVHLQDGHEFLLNRLLLRWKALQLEIMRFCFNEITESNPYFIKSAFVRFLGNCCTRGPYKCHVIFICWNYIVGFQQMFSWLVWIKKILSTPSITNFPLKILWRQCSELAWESENLGVCQFSTILTAKSSKYPTSSDSKTNLLLYKAISSMSK